MLLRERIMKLPLWKAAVIVLFGWFVLMVGVEELFFRPIFSVINNMVTRFEKQDKAEQAEWDADEKATQAFNKEWDDDFQKMWNERAEEDRQRHIRDDCNEIKELKNADTYMAELKKKDLNKVKDLVERVLLRERLKELIKDIPQREKSLKSAKNRLLIRKFDANKCGEITS